MLELMFLKLDGVRGEGYAPRHIGEIELSSFTRGKPKGAGAGSGGAGKASINDLTVIDLRQHGDGKRFASEPA